MEAIAKLAKTTEESLTDLALIAATDDPEQEGRLLTRMLDARDDAAYRMEVLAEKMERVAAMLTRWAKIARQEAEIADRR